ncbi:MAG: pyridoxamine 5'-phosphate oxidase family protein [Actinomycetota bacterium]|nr:pyridoxamine 5'-phosphate oxidase family protein [Actinomycetota bacterium]
MTRALAELTYDECVELLSSHHFGRLAVVVEGRPVVFPVNYEFSEGRIVIRTDPGVMLDAATLASVAFEIDEVDVASRSGWSVVVQGFSQDVTDAVDPVSELLRAVPVDPWAPGTRTHWIRIEARLVSGRRLGDLA